MGPLTTGLWYCWASPADLQLEPNCLGQERRNFATTSYPPPAGSSFSQSVLDKSLNTTGTDKSQVASLRHPQVWGVEWPLWEWVQGAGLWGQREFCAMFWAGSRRYLLPHEDSHLSLKRSILSTERSWPSHLLMAVAYFWDSGVSVFTVCCVCRG